MKEFFFNEFATLKNANLVKVNSFTSLFLKFWSQISDHLLTGTSSNSCFITLELFCIKYPLISIIVLNNLHDWPIWKNDLGYNPRLAIFMSVWNFILAKSVSSNSFPRVEEWNYVQVWNFMPAWVSYRLHLTTTLETYLGTCQS